MALRGGDVVPAVHAYADHGRVTITGTIDQARQQIVEDWWAVHHKHTTAILAVRRADVSALNDMIRARREAGGELGEEVRIGDKAFSVGDRVIFEKNQRVAEAGPSPRTRRPSSVRIRNGTFGTVVGVVDPVGNVVTREGDVPRAQGDVAGTEKKESRTREACALVVELEDARRAVLPHSYVETSTSLGYALTVFRSQGITVDHTFGLGGDSLFQEAGYTQLSRGRLSNNLYVAAPENPRWEIGHQAEDAVQRDALQSLVDALSQSREQTMAQDRLPIWPAASPDELATTYHRHATMARWLCDQAPLDVTDELAAASDRARDARVAGRDTDAALTELSALAAQQRHRNAWVAHHRDEITTWSDLDRAVRRTEYRLGQVATYNRPEHITALLGSLPERITEVERWQTAAGAIEAYRNRWNITDTTTVGPEPTDPEQRSHWVKTVATVGAAGFLNPGGSYEAGTERASLATRWEHIHAVDRQTHNDRDVERSHVPSPASLWLDEPDVNLGFDDGLGI